MLGNFVNCQNKQTKEIIPFFVWDLGTLDPLNTRKFWVICRAVLSRWFKYSEALYTLEQTSPQHFHLCSFFLPEPNYWASLEEHPFLLNCRLKTFCISVSRLLDISAPVALYWSVGCIWETPRYKLLSPILCGFALKASMWAWRKAGL